MKKLGLLIVCAFIYCLSSNAQECSATLLLKEGNVLEYANFDKKGKKTSTTIHETISVQNEPDVLNATIKGTVKDVKQDDEFSMEYNVTCRDGLISVDMARFFDMNRLQQYGEEDFVVEIDGTVLEFPSGALAGDNLNDGSITVRVAKEGFTIVTMIMDVKNRKVHANESITTDAGTFNCQKVTYDFYTKFGILKISGSGTEWYQGDRVLVKSETYNKKGKLVGSAELTKISE